MSAPGLDATSLGERPQRLLQRGFRPGIDCGEPLHQRAQMSVIPGALKCLFTPSAS
jgi:hypothetical protein